MGTIGYDYEQAICVCLKCDKMYIYTKYCFCILHFIDIIENFIIILHNNITYIVVALPFEFLIIPKIPIDQKMCAKFSTFSILMIVSYFN